MEEQETKNNGLAEEELSESEDFDLCPDSLAKELRRVPFAEEAGGTVNRRFAFEVSDLWDDDEIDDFLRFAEMVKRYKEVR